MDGGYPYRPAAMGSILYKLDFYIVNPRNQMTMDGMDPKGQLLFIFYFFLYFIVERIHQALFHP